MKIFIFLSIALTTLPFSDPALGKRSLKIIDQSGDVELCNSNCQNHLPKDQRNADCTSCCKNYNSNALKGVCQFRQKFQTAGHDNCFCVIRVIPGKKPLPMSQCHSHCQDNKLSTDKQNNRCDQCCKDNAISAKNGFCKPGGLLKRGKKGCHCTPRGQQIVTKSNSRKMHPRSRSQRGRSIRRS